MRLGGGSAPSSSSSLFCFSSTPFSLHIYLQIPIRAWWLDEGIQVSGRSAVREKTRRGSSQMVRELPFDDCIREPHLPNGERDADFRPVRQVRRGSARKEILSGTALHRRYREEMHRTCQKGLQHAVPRTSDPSAQLLRTWESFSRSPSPAT